MDGRGEWADFENSPEEVFWQEIQEDETWRDLQFEEEMAAEEEAYNSHILPEWFRELGEFHEMGGFDDEIQQGE